MQKKIAMKAARNKDVKVIETSTYTNRKRAEQLGIRSVPTLFITNPDYKEKIGYIGVPSEKQLNKMINISQGKEDWPKKKPGLLSKLANIKIKW